MAGPKDDEPIRGPDHNPDGSIKDGTETPVPEFPRRSEPDGVIRRNWRPIFVLLFAVAGMVLAILLRAGIL